MTRQVTFAGSFFDAGVKKLATAFSRDCDSSVGSLRTGSNDLTCGSGLDFTFLQRRG